MKTSLVFENIEKTATITSEAVEIVFVETKSHNYLIPKEEEEEFEKLVDQIDAIGLTYSDDYYDLCSKLDNKFSQYRIESNYPQLYAKVGYEKEL